MSTRWRTFANCRGLGDYYFCAPEGESAIERVQRELMARGIGASCAVLDECRRYALDTDQLHGIWGGLTEPERAECAEKCCCTTTAADIRAPSVSAFLIRADIGIAGEAAASADSVVTRIDVDGTAVPDATLMDISCDADSIAHARQISSG